MGSSNSRMGSQSGRPNRIKRAFSSIFICGSSPSRSPVEMEDDPAELLVDSAEHADNGKLQNSEKDPSPDLVPSQAEHGASSASNPVNSEKSTSEEASSNVQGGNRRENSTKDVELVTQYSLGCTDSETASTSRDDRPFHYPLSLDKRTDGDGVNNVNTAANGDISQVFAGSSYCSSPLYHGNGESSPDYVVNHTNEVLIFNNSDSASVSDSSVTPRLAGDDLRQDTPSSSFEFQVSEREEGVRDGSVLHVDMANVSPSIWSNSPVEISSREARRNNRRLFWDSFSRRSPRRRSDPRNFHFSNDNSDDVASHDRLLLDFSDSTLHEAGGNFPSNGGRTYGSNERRRHSRSEMWERLPGGLIASDHRSATCPTGIHPDGPCSCETILMTRESGSRASISRIVMLAEALFEVLDEIHRQPMSLSLSVLSLPAPESVVDSFPIKSYSKPEEADTGNNVFQCHICLAEYEEADKIRILPCHHEFHVSCVDKWLKEIHGVCPLCRGDVRNGFVEASVSNSAAPSI